MIDPSFELQVAIVTALKAASPVTALVNQRVYDSVPAEADRIQATGDAWPYVSLGQPQILPERADCIDSADVAYDVHGWCKGPQSVAVKHLGKAIAGALDGAELVLDGHHTVDCLVEQIQYLDDPDGLTKHVVVSFRVQTDPTA